MLGEALHFEYNRDNDDLLHDLSKIQSLTNLDLATITVKNESLKVIINSFRSLGKLTIREATHLDRK